MGAFISTAMRSFANWATARPHRTVLLVVAFAYYLAPVAAALLIVSGLRRGIASAGVTALVASLVVAVIAVIAGGEVAVTLALTLPALAGGLASAVLLHWSRSLSLSFQALAFGLIVLAAAIFGLFPEADRIGEVVQAELLTLFEYFGAEASVIAQFAAVDAGEFVRVLLVLRFVSVMMALMLGLWWYALIEPGVRFGEQFRALRLGRTVGIVLMLAVVADQFVDAPAIEYVAPMAVIGFLFQGLAVMHARSHSDGWPRAVIVVAYVALFVMGPLMLVGLSAVGLLDNFFELRQRAAADE